MIHDEIWWGRVPGVPGVIDAYAFSLDVICHVAPVSESSPFPSDVSHQ